MSFKNWLEGKNQDIANLQPDTVISVFHGTDIKDAYNFCLNGVDAKKFKHYRVYSQHSSGGKPLKFGLFVAPNLKTAHKFGNYIIKFKAQGKDLIYQFPIEQKTSDKSDWMKASYPNSFRPTVSHDMLKNSVEPQALYVGLLSPRAIEKVYYWKLDRTAPGTGKGELVSVTSEEFIKQTKEQDRGESSAINRIHKSIYEPQEYKMSFDDFVKRMAEDQDSTPEEIVNILKRIYKRNGYLSGIGNVPYSLQRRIEAHLRNLISKESQ